MTLHPTLSQRIWLLLSLGIYRLKRTRLGEWLRRNKMMKVYKSKDHSTGWHVYYIGSQHIWDKAVPDQNHKITLKELMKTRWIA